MIYSVDLALGTEQSDEDWDRWVAEMRTPDAFMAIPGFLTMQRFKEMTARPPRYLAMYSVPSPEAVVSAEYRGADGGNLRRNNWLQFITLWHRNVWDGAESAPNVADDEVLVMFDAAAPTTNHQIPGLTWTRAIGLDKSTPYRGLAHLKRDAAKPWISRPDPEIRVYAPTMPMVTTKC